MKTTLTAAALGVTLAAAAGLTSTTAPSAAAAGDRAPTAAPATASGTASTDPEKDRIALGLPDTQTLVPRKSTKGTKSDVFVRYDRTFKGLRVIGGDLVVTKNASTGTIVDVVANGTGKVDVPSTTPTVSLKAATATGARRASMAAPATRGTLVVYAAGSTPRLAYDVLTTGTKPDGTPSRLHTIVDATTGATLTSYDEIQTGTGNTQYSGQVTLNTTGSAGAYRMQDPVGNRTTDMGGATSGSGTLFTDADNVWGSGSNGNRQTAGADAQYGAEKTFAYYTSVLGRRGINDDGRGALSRVHYGQNYQNAFWDGTQMTYGDGPNNATPFTSLDVAAHEMTHGVTERTAGLVYNGESGGLNEATSDIFAAGTEFAANNATDKGDYLVGERLGLGGPGVPLRYMDKPSKDGASRDCWSSDLGSVDVHYSSGPLNHWFFMASEGSGAKTINGVSYNSPTCRGAAAVTGAGRVAMEKIWYRTLASKLTSTSDYADAREGAIASAKELYGTTSKECVAVEKAFNAIAVPAGAQKCGAANVRKSLTLS